MLRIFRACETTNVCLYVIFFLFLRMHEILHSIQNWRVAEFTIGNIIIIY